MTRYVLRTRNGHFWIGRDGDGSPQLVCDYASRTKYNTREAAIDALRQLVARLTGDLRVAEDESSHSLPDGARKC